MRWLHRQCEEQVYNLLKERDHVEGRLARLQRAYDELTTAYQSLVTAVNTKGTQETFSKMLSEMWEEVPTPEDKHTYLTPALEEREGVTDA